MEKVNKRNQTRRLDLSDSLVHFFQQDNKNLFEILKIIIADGQIKCGWADD